MRPKPEITEETKHFWQGASEGRFCLPECLQCKCLIFPPRARCPHCLSKQASWKSLSGEGRVRAWTEVFLEVFPGSSKPTVIVEFEPIEDRSVSLPLIFRSTSTDGLAIGGAVRVGFTKDQNDIVYPSVDLGSPVADVSGVAVND